jgi:hypothetical protein
MPKSIDEFTPAEWDLAVKEARKLYREEQSQPNVTEVTKMFPEAMEAMQKVVDLGGMKYGYGSFLDADNNSLQHRNNHASMARHLAEGYMGVKEDVDSGVHPYLHLAMRALMEYTRIARGIEDE